MSAHQYIFVLHTCNICIKEVISLQSINECGVVQTNAHRGYLTAGERMQIVKSIETTSNCHSKLKNIAKIVQEPLNGKSGKQITIMA